MPYQDAQTDTNEDAKTDAKTDAIDHFADLAKLAKLRQLTVNRSDGDAARLNAAFTARDRLADSATDLLTVEGHKRREDTSRRLVKALQTGFQQVADMNDRYVQAGPLGFEPRRALLRKTDAFANVHRDDSLDYEKIAEALNGSIAPFSGTRPRFVAATARAYVDACAELILSLNTHAKEVEHFFEAGDNGARRDDIDEFRNKLGLDHQADRDTEMKRLEEVVKKAPAWMTRQRDQNALSASEPVARRLPDGARASEHVSSADITPASSLLPSRQPDWSQLDRNDFSQPPSPSPEPGGPANQESAGRRRLSGASNSVQEGTTSMHRQEIESSAGHASLAPSSSESSPRAGFKFTASQVKEPDAQIPGWQPAGLSQSQPAPSLSSPSFATGNSRKRQSSRMGNGEPAAKRGSLGSSGPSRNPVIHGDETRGERTGTDTAQSAVTDNTENIPSARELGGPRPPSLPGPVVREVPENLSSDPRYDLRPRQSRDVREV